MLDFLCERGICPFWPQNPKKLPLQIFNDDEHSRVHEAWEVSNKCTVKDKFIEIHFKDLSIHFSIKVGNNLCSTQDYINTILELKSFSRRLVQKILFFFFFFGNRIQIQIIIPTHSSIQKYICETILIDWFPNLKFCV